MTALCLSFSIWKMGVMIPTSFIKSFEIYQYKEPNKDKVVVLLLESCPLL